TAVRRHVGILAGDGAVHPAVSWMSGEVAQPDGLACGGGCGEARGRYPGVLPVEGSGGVAPRAASRAEVDLGGRAGEGDERLAVGSCGIACHPDEERQLVAAHAAGEPGPRLAAVEAAEKLEFARSPDD